MGIQRLSVVDVGWPGHVLTLAPKLESFGYHRYWTTEHYSASQSSSPTVLAAVAAQCTSVLRVGTAGVLLHHAPALRVANDFALLELLYPGRIDMGVAGATGGPAVVDALGDQKALAPSQYPNRVRDLAKLQRLSSWNTGDPRAEILGPSARSQSPLWVCGTGHASAALAAELGAGYAFHDHLCSPDTDGPAVIAAYQQNFVPGLFRSEPAVVVACTGAIGDSEEDSAATLAQHGLEQSSFSGPAQQITEQLETLACRYNVDELAIYVVNTAPSQQIEGYGSIAESLGLV